MQDLGRIAYEGYGRNRAWKTFNGDDMLSWDLLGQDLRAGWDAAAEAVTQVFFSADDAETDCSA